MKTAVIRRTPFGSIGLVWTLDRSGPKLIRVVLSHPHMAADNALARQYPAVPHGSCAEIDAAAAAVRATLEGHDARFSISMLALGSCSTFQHSVLRAVCAIPRGRVSTYRLLALHLHTPAAPRAVGRALATNPFPLLIPCHRIVRSDLHPGGYAGGPAMKRALLEREGIRFDPTGRLSHPHLHHRSILT